MNSRWKHGLITTLAPTAGVFAILASIQMIFDGFVRHWDIVRRDFVHDTNQGLLGICVLLTGLFTLKYAVLVANTLYPQPKPPTIRDAAARQLEEAQKKRSPLVLPGDREFHT